MYTINRRITLSAIFILAFTSHSIAFAAKDWPQWLGPNGNNHVTTADAFDPDLNNWNVAWEKEVGLGYSTITTAEGKVFTMGHDGKSQETIVAIDQNTGDEIWSYSYEGDLIPAMHVGGPNASVLISGGYAYAVSKDGQLICLNAATGEKVWNTFLTELLDMEVPKWGFGSSPVAYRDTILVSAGKVTAFEKTTGAVRWISKEDRKAGYGTPTVFNRHGREYIAVTDSDGLSILKAEDGSQVARKDMRVKFNVISTSPAVFEDGNKILLYNNSFSELYDFDGESLSISWSDRRLKNTLHGSVRLGDQLFGLNGGHKNKRTSFFSRSFDDGRELWSVPNFGYATVIAVNDTLIILTENGELITAPASSEGFEEISRKKLLDSICWTSPTFAGGKIFIRNEHGKLIVLKQA